MTRNAVERPRSRENFYASVLDEADLIEAAKVEGVDDELAALRVRLKNMLKERPEDYELMLKGAQLIVRAAGARYRMSAQSKDELGSAIAGVIRGVGVQLFPEDDGDV